MTARSILQADESLIHESGSVALRESAVRVDASNVVEARRVADDLLETMASQPLCVGLAANQIGERLQIAVIQRPDDEPLVLLNPTIVSTSGKKDKKRESCMSVWGLTAEVERRTKATVAYEDLDLRAHEATFEGFTSRVVQHEIDHLNGVLYVDIASTSATQTNLFEGYSPHAKADEVP